MTTKIERWYQVSRAHRTLACWDSNERPSVVLDRAAGQPCGLYGPGAADFYLRVYCRRKRVLTQVEFDRWRAQGGEQARADAEFFHDLERGATTVGGVTPGSVALDAALDAFQVGITNTLERVLKEVGSRPQWTHNPARDMAELIAPYVRAKVGDLVTVLLAQPPGAGTVIPPTLDK